MTRALYGLRIREPYTQEFGFSGRLGANFLHIMPGTMGAARRHRAPLDDGRDCRRQRICQSFLGQKDHVERHAADLVPALQTNDRPAVLRPWNQLFRRGVPDRLAAGSHYRTRSRSSPGASTSKSKATAGNVLDRSGGVGIVFHSILSPSTLADLQRIARLEEEISSIPRNCGLKRFTNLPLRTTSPSSTATILFRRWRRFSAGERSHFCWKTATAPRPTWKVISKAYV